MLAHLPERKPSRRDRAVGRLPHPGPDHGARQPRDGRRHARPAGADVGPLRRRPAADRPRRLARRRRGRRSRRSCSASCRRAASPSSPPTTAATRSPTPSTPPGMPTGGRRRPGSTSRSRSCRSAWSRGSSSTPSWWSSRPRSSASDEHGLRALYVALTRSTQRLSVVHRQDLPERCVTVGFVTARHRFAHGGVPGRLPSHLG